MQTNPFSVLWLLTALLPLAACQDSAWPPPRIEGGVPDEYGPPFKLETNDQIETFGHVYDDPTHANSIDWGMSVGKGRMQMAGNLFAIEELGLGAKIMGKAPEGNCYADNQIEVLYFDDQRTIIELKPEREDHLIFHAIACAGTKALYRGVTYELRDDGWYVEGAKVSELKQAA